MGGFLGGRRSWRIGSILASAGLVAGMLAATTGSAAAVAGGAPSLACSGGDFGSFTPEMISSGTYSTLTVTGFCEIAPGATIIVKSGLTVAPGGFLAASDILDTFMGNPPGCNRTITVSGGIDVGAFGSLFLGDGPGSGCDPKTQTTVSGGLSAAGPLFLVVHGVTINGGLSSVGGGDDQPCNWAGIPTYATVEDSQINGDVTVSGYAACFLGFIRNRVNGTVSLTNNSEPTDEIDVGDNDVHGSLLCSGNDPLENTGGSPSTPSRVTGQNTCNLG